jgi:hypothetical protein
LRHPVAQNKEEEPFAKAKNKTRNKAIMTSFNQGFWKERNER